MSRIYASTLLFWLMLCQGAFADTGPWFPFGHPTGTGIISSTKKDAAGNPQLYGGSSGQPDNWSFYQWQTTSDFPPLSFNQGTNEWVAGNGMSAIHWFPPMNGGAATIALAQNGQYLPCQNGEFDLGLGPNGWVAANNPTQYPVVANKDSARINLMTHLYMNGTFTLNSARSGGSSSYQCDVNQANAGLSLVLLNKVTNPYQFFYYNLHLSETCVQSGTANDQYSSCQQNVNLQNPQWFWTGISGPNMHNDGVHPVWGMDDHLSAYGVSGSNITDNNSRGLAVDMLPRVRQLIANNPYGMDPDQSHWEVTGTGFGQATWGNVYFATTFTDFVVLYSCMDNVQNCPASN